MNFNIKDLLEKEEDWCKYMGYKNVYLDPFKYHITDGTITTDGKAYKSFPKIGMYMTNFGLLRHKI